jgi:hypothetical protein
MRISYHCSVDLDRKVKNKKCIWMNGKIRRVSDGTWKLTARSTIRCHPVGQAAEVLFDAVPTIGYATCKESVPLRTILWNKDREGACCKDLRKIDYGIGQ